MKTTRTKPATSGRGRRFLQLTAALTAVLLGTPAFAGPNEMWSVVAGITGGTITPSPRVLAIDGAGASYTVGYGDTGPGTPGEAFIVKIDSAGNPVWVSNFSGVIGGATRFTDGALDSAGDLVATGFVQNALGVEEWLNVKYDAATGARSANWPDIGLGVGVRIINAGGVNIRGSRVEPAGVPGVVISGATGNAMLMVQLDASGNLSANWPDIGNGQGFRVYQPAGGVVDITAPVLVKFDATSRYNLAGTGVFNTTGLDYIVTKYTSGGSFVWDAKYSPAAVGTDRLFDLQVDNAGHCFVTGESFDVGNSQFEMATVRFNQGAGAIGWSARSGGSGGGRKLAIVSGGATYVAGFGSSNNTMSVWKYNAAGNLHTVSWPAAGGNPAGVRRLGGTIGDQAEDITINGSTIYVTGKVTDGGIPKMTTWKINGSNGNTNWIERFGNLGDETSGVAVKIVSGILIGTGFTRPIGGGGDSLVVIRYVP
jgi:hypothetical protein